MHDPETPREDLARIAAAGFAHDAVQTWLDRIDALCPGEAAAPTRLATDMAAAAPLFAEGRTWCAALPLKSRRAPAERAAGAVLVRRMAALCKRLCRAHRETIYRVLTGDLTRFVRADALLWEAAERWPGLVPTRAELGREAERMQKDKDGLELHQGLFLAQMLSAREPGLHLLAAMMRPRPESRELLGELRAQGALTIGDTRVEVAGAVGRITTSNPGYLNAEDDEVNETHERAVDLVLLHPEVEIGVIRGAPVAHPRYRGRRVFDAGINLTKLYHGRISYLFYVNRETGIYNKIYRGIADGPWDIETAEDSVEKPWIAVVDSFAIGGGCQLLLVTDYVIAESGAYCNLPARKEGIIPGAANLRLPRFIGERSARHGIMFDRTFAVDSPAGAALVNEVVASDEIDAALERTIAAALSSGMVSAAGNRRALRVVAEPLDAHRRYLALYCEEQARCHLSDQLIANLEKNWHAGERRLKEPR